MKKLFSVILCIVMLLTLVPMSASAATNVTIFNITVPEPEIGAKPGYASVPDTASTLVTKTKWDGELDENGCFKADTAYTVYVTVRIKIGQDKVIKYNPDTCKVNGNFAEMLDITEDKKYGTIKYTFYIAGEEEELPPVEVVPGPVDDFEPGDSGTLFLMGNASYYSKPKTDSELHLGSYATSGGATIEVVEAYVPSLNREGEYFHVIKRGVTGDIVYLEANPAKGTFSDYYRTGNNPNRPYEKMWRGEIKYGDPIEEIGTWILDFPDGKPTYKFIGSIDEKEGKFYLESIVYDHPDGVEPYTYENATATFKAADGYYFDYLLKMNEYQYSAEHTMGFKRIDDKTVEVYLTAFTGSLGYDVKITEDMKEFNKKFDEMNLVYTGTAQFYSPVYDHWKEKLDNRDYEFNTYYIDKFMEDNCPILYAYPTDSMYDTEGHMVFGSGKDTSSWKNMLEVRIVDLDLSDDLPGLVVEWCLLSDGSFIPKACLKDIKNETIFTGAPAEYKNSPFKFEGGSGTMEDPYLVATAEQLDAVRKGPRYHYKLIADIDLSNWGNWIPIGGTAGYGFMGGDWNMVHDGAYAFCGSFDGNGHVISGMTIVVNEETPFLTEVGNYRAFGLFGNLATNPDNYEIKNLGVVDFTIDVDYTNMKKNVEIYAAAICGGMNNGTNIINCYSSGGTIDINVKFNPETAAANPDYAPRAIIEVGGIASKGGGVFLDSSRKTKMHIEKCFNASDINVNVEGSEFVIYAGGIISLIDTTHIHECYNSGNISIPVQEGDYEESWHNSIAGGIAAYATIPEIPHVYHVGPEGASFIQNSYNTGTISARSAAGIFNFSSCDIHLENCYNIGEIKGNQFDASVGYTTINPIISGMAAVVPFGTEFVRNCYTNGNSVSGSAWTYSQSLGRKVLKAIPEDKQPEKPAEHVHAWDKGIITKEATKTEAGEKLFTCAACGVIKTEVIPKISEIPPVCDHVFAYKYCTLCGAREPYEEKVDINYRAIKIVLDGVEITPCDGAGTTVEPFIMSSSGTTYLPLRAVSQALGLNVHWDANTNTVKLSSGGTVKTGLGPASNRVGQVRTMITYRNIRVILDDKLLSLVNNLGVAVDPFILNSNSSVYLPLRIIGEALGLTVNWDGNTSTVYLTSKQG